MPKCDLCHGTGYISSGEQVVCPWCYGSGKVSYCKCEICGKANNKPGQMFYAHNHCVEKASGKPILPLEENRK